MRTLLRLGLAFALLFGGAGGAEAKRASASIPAFPDVERVVVADTTSPLGEVVLTRSKDAVVTKRGRVQTEPCVGLFRADGFVKDGGFTFTFLPASRNRAESWKLVAKSTGRGADRFVLSALADAASGDLSNVVVKARRMGSKTVVTKGAGLDVSLTSDDPRPARLDSGFYAKLSLPAGASMARAHEVRLLDDGQTMVVAGTAVFPDDGTPTNFRPCAWFVTVNDIGTLTETFVPLWGELGTEGEAWCVGPNGDIGGEMRTADSSKDIGAGMPAVWHRAEGAFSIEALYDPLPGDEAGRVDALGPNGVAGRMDVFPFEQVFGGAPVFKAGESGGAVYDCSASFSVQVGFVSAKPVRWFGKTMTIMRNSGAGYAYGCSRSGNFASGMDTRLEGLACVWDARGRLMRLTRDGAKLHGPAWVITDAGEAFGVRYFTERFHEGADQALDSEAFVKPVGSTDVLDWASYLETLAGTMWLSGYEASATGEIPESFLGGDNRRSSWGVALTGWTSSDNAFVLWLPKR